MNEKTTPHGKLDYLVACTNMTGMCLYWEATTVPENATTVPENEVTTEPENKITIEKSPMSQRVIGKPQQCKRMMIVQPTQSCQKMLLLLQVIE